DLRIDIGARVADVHPIAVQDLDVGPELELLAEFGLQILVAESSGLQDVACTEGEGLVLCREVRRPARRAVRGPQLEFVDLRDEPPRLPRDPPRSRHAAEGGPALARPEQRAAVPPNAGFRAIAVLVVNRNAPGHADRPDVFERRDGARAGG